MDEQRLYFPGFEPSTEEEPPKPHSRLALFSRTLTLQFIVVISIAIVLCGVRLLSPSGYEAAARSYKAAFFSEYDFTQRCAEVYRSVNDFFQKDDIPVPIPEPDLAPEPPAADGSAPEAPAESAPELSEASPESAPEAPPSDAPAA